MQVQLLTLPALRVEWRVLVGSVTKGRGCTGETYHTLVRNDSDQHEVALPATYECMLLTPVLVLRHDVNSAQISYTASLACWRAAP